jgi:hypothetical protein
MEWHLQHGLNRFGRPPELQLGCVKLPPSHSLSRLLAGLCLAAAVSARAGTVQTVGAGSAVATVDLSDDFNSFANTDLSVYSADGLSVTTPGFEYDTNLDPFGGAGDRSGFYYPGGGAAGWTTIETDDQSLMSGVEFLYGNGWQNGSYDGLNTVFGSDTAVLYWQTLDGNTVESCGSVVLDVGTVVGFSDPAGFEELQVSAAAGPESPPGENALALDDLNVQLAPPVPDLAGGWWFYLGMVAGLLCWCRRRFRSHPGGI